MMPVYINRKEGPYRVCLCLCLHPSSLDRPTTAPGSPVGAADSISKKKIHLSPSFPRQLSASIGRHLHSSILCLIISFHQHVFYSYLQKSVSATTIKRNPFLSQCETNRICMVERVNISYCESSLGIC